MELFITTAVKTSNPIHVIFGGVKIKELMCLLSNNWHDEGTEKSIHCKASTYIRNSSRSRTRIPSGELQKTHFSSGRKYVGFITILSVCVCLAVLHTDNAEQSDQFS
jgi:hypothetical protein